MADADSSERQFGYRILPAVILQFTVQPGFMRVGRFGFEEGRPKKTVVKAGPENSISRQFSSCAAHIPYFNIPVFWRLIFSGGFFGFVQEILDLPK